MNTIAMDTIAMANTNVDVLYASNQANLPEQNMLSRWVKAALDGHNYINNKSKSGGDKEEIEIRSWELSIRIIDEVEAQQLNEKWRQRPYPTNVLSFPIAMDSFESLPGIEISLLGDIVICAPLVAREAAAQKKSLYAHWAHLVIHGTLHLLGYDHISDSQARTMESLEIRVLHDLGYPNPYHTT